MASPQSFSYSISPQSFYFLNSRPLKTQHIRVSESKTAQQGQPLPTVLSSLLLSTLFNELTSLRVQAGTQITIQVPFRLQVSATNNTNLSTCIQSYQPQSTSSFVSSVNTSVKCLFQILPPYQYITYTIANNYTNLQFYALYFGPILNPSACLQPNSFILTFSGGYPTGNKSSGLIAQLTPGLIYSTSFSADSYQAIVGGALDNYTFKFSVMHNIPSGGYIRLIFPSKDWADPLTTYLTTIQVTIGTTQTNITNTLQMTKTNDIILSSLFSSDFTASSSSPILIRILNIRNPKLVTQTSSIVIQTLDSQKSVIDQSSSYLGLNVIYFGSIKVTNFTASSTQIDTSTSITLNIETNSASYSSGGQMEIIAPYPYIALSSSSLSCNSYYGFESSVLTCSQGANSYTIDVMGDLDPQSQYQSFVVFSFTNPLGQLSIPSYQVYFYNADLTVAGQITSGLSYTTTGGVCRMTSATRDSTKLRVNQTGASYQITFNCDNRLTLNSQITIFIPQEQMQQTTFTKCTQSELTCQISNNNNDTLITLTYPSSASAGYTAKQSLQILITNASNPNKLIDQADTPSIQIMTFNKIFSTDLSFLTVDTITSGLYFSGTLAPVLIADLSVSLPNYGSSFSNTGGIKQYIFKFSLSSFLDPTGIITVSFPPQTAFYDIGTAISCTSNGKKEKVLLNTSAFGNLTLLNSIQFIDLCKKKNLGCQQKTQFKFIISGVQNPFFSKSSNVTYTITTSTSQGYQIDQGTSTVQFPSLDGSALSVSLVSPTGSITVGQNVTYIIQVQNPKNMIPGVLGSLLVTFPSEVHIQTGSICTASTSSNILNCIVIGQKLNITTTYDIPSGSTITVVVPYSVANPPIIQISSTFLVQSFYYGIYLIDYSSTLRVSSTAPNTLRNVKVTRNTTSPNVFSLLTLCFNSANPIPANSQIEISIPNDQIQIVNNTVKLTTNATQYANLTSTKISNAIFSVLTVNEWCSRSSKCNPYNQQCMTIDGLKNPVGVRVNISSVLVQVKKSGAVITDRIDSGVQIVPFIGDGSLTVNLIKRDTDVINQSPTYIISVMTDPLNGSLSGLYQPVLLISFPQNYLFTTSKTSPLAQISNDNVTWISSNSSFNLQVNPDGLGNYVQNVSVTLKCGFNDFQCNNFANIFVKISGNGLANSPDTTSFSGQIITVATMYSIDKSLYNVKNSGYFQIGFPLATQPDLSPFTSGPILISSISRNVSTVDTVSSLTISLTLSSKLKKNGLINILIPTSEFQLTGDSILYQTKFSSTSPNLVPTYLGQQSNFTIISLPEWCTTKKTTFCSEGTTFTFRIISGLKNQRIVSSTQSNFMFSSINPDGTEVDFIGVGGFVSPLITPSALKILEITLSSNSVAQGGVDLTVQISFGTDLQSTDSIILTFSDPFVRNDKGTLFCSLITSRQTTKTCLYTVTDSIMTQIVMSNLCTSSSGCSSSDPYTIRISNLYNLLEPSAYAGSLTIDQIQALGSTISTGKRLLSSVSALQAQLLPSASVSRNTAIQNSSAIFYFAFSTPSNALIQANSTLVLYLPFDQIILQDSKTAFIVKSGSTTLSFNQTYNAQFYILTGYYWNCLSSNCFSSSSVNLTITNGANPVITKSWFNNFTVQVVSPAGNIVMQNDYPLIASPALAITALTNVLVANSNTTYSLDKTVYNISFKTIVDLPLSGQFKFVFPANRVTQDTANPAIVCSYNGVNQTTKYYWTTSSSGLPILTINITQLCLSAVCPAGTYAFLCIGGMKNPSPLPSISSNFSIYTTDVFGVILQSSSLSNSQLSVLKPVLIIPKVTIQSLYVPVGLLVNVSFTTSSALPSNGKLIIVIPFTSTSVPLYAPTCVNGKILQAVACDILYADLTQILISMSNQFCSSSACAASSSINVLLRFAGTQTIPASGSIVWQVYTTNGNGEVVDGALSGIVPSILTCN